MKFVIDSQSITISVDFDSAIAAVKEVVSELIGIPATDLDLLYCKSEIDDDMTLNDLEVLPSDFITIVSHTAPAPPAAAPAPAAPPSTPPGAVLQLRVILLLGIIPRMALFRKDAGQTLADLAPDVAEKWELGDLEFEFVTGDPGEENWRVVPRSTPLTEVPDKDSDEALAVRPATWLAEAPASAGGSAALFDTVSTQARAPPPPPADDTGTGTPYRFNFDGGREQTLRFEAGAKVQAARERVARDLGVAEDAVTLLFAGKPLKDQFLLSRLRVGDAAIIVCIRDDQAVLIVTAKANRR
jgi:hypothetical protein